MLPPVIAELRANIGEYAAKMRTAREEWASTAATLGNPEPMAAVQTQLGRVSTHMHDTVRSTEVLRETTRETFAEMTAGAARAVPGIGELSRVVGSVTGHFGEMRAAASEALGQTTAQAEALRIEIKRLELAEDAQLRKMLEIDPASRSFTIANDKALAYRAQIDKLNASLARTVAEERAIKGRAARGHLLGIGAGGAAIGAAVGAGVAYESIKAALGAEAAQAQLAQAVRNTGHEFEAIHEPLESVTKQMRSYGFTNVDTVQSATRLTQMLHNPEKALNLVGLAANLARARNIDLATATNIVGKAATGHVGMLARYGFQTKDAAGHTLKASEAIRLMGQSFGHSANAYRSTLRGQLATMHAQLDNALEQIGVHLIPAVTALLGHLMALGSFLKTHLGPPLVFIAHLYAQHRTLVKALAIGVLSFVAAYKTFAAIKNAVLALRAAWWGLNTAMAANPVGVVIAAIIGLGLALVYAWKHSETFRRVVLGAWHAVKVGVGEAVHAIIDYYIRPVVHAYLWMAQQVVHAMAHAFGWIPKLGGKLKAASRDVDEFAKATDATLKGWAESAQHWGDEHVKALTGAAAVEAQVAAATQRLQRAYDSGNENQIRVAEMQLANAKAAAAAYAKAHPAKTKAKVHVDPEFDIDGNYADGIVNAVDRAKKKAKKKVHHKNHDDAHRKAMAKLRAQLRLEAEQALFEADKVARAREAALRRSLQAAQELARQLDVQNKLNGKAANQLNMVDGALLNRGTGFASFAQTAARTAPVVNVTVQGRVSTERDLVAAVHEGLLTYDRQNINSGLG